MPMRAHSQPCSTRFLTTCDPMYPLAPVTATGPSAEVTGAMMMTDKTASAAGRAACRARRRSKRTYRPSPERTNSANSIYIYVEVPINSIKKNSDDMLTRRAGCAICRQEL
jgi:hypothetical protein